MYAIVEIGSTQFKVSEGEIIRPLRLKGEPGDEINLDKILMFSKGDEIRVGQPYLKDIKVTAKIVEHDRGPRVTAYKYRRRKSSAVKKGARSNLTALNITKISA